MTRSQKRVLAAIAEVNARGTGPTYRELARTLGYRSNVGAVDTVRRLIRDGFVTADRGPIRGLTRTLRVTPAGAAMLPRRVFVRPRVCACGCVRFGKGDCPQCKTAVAA